MMDNSKMDKIFAADYVVHTGDKNHKGTRFIERWAKQLRSATEEIS